MKLQIEDFENVKVDIKEFIEYIMPSNKQSMNKLARILYPDSNEKDYDSLTNYLYVMLDGIEKDYEEFTIKKKNGKLRTISKPNEALADIQKRIYEYILRNAPVSPCAAAYVKGKSIRDATAKHIGQPILIKIDVKDFFYNIFFDSVNDAFTNLGFDKYQAITLANFCCYKGSLPQGTSTSPMLSNLVFRDFDDEMEKLCLKYNIRYTRYSDDMLFSGSFDNEFDTKRFVPYVKFMLEDFGFQMNLSKTKIIKQGQRQTALGVVLNEKQQVTKEYRKQIRQEIHYCSEHSVKSHLEHIQDERFLLPNGEPDYIGYIDNLNGRINFALQINPDDMEMVSYKNSLKSLSSSMYQAKVVEQNQLMECLYKVFSDYVNSKIKYTILYKKLLEYGFSNSQLSKIGIYEEKIVYGFDEVYLTKDDKGNYLSLITKHSCSEHLGNVIINPYCDGFFGSRFDKNLGYLTVTSDKIAAVTSGLTNYVSFNNAPSKFFLSKKKLEMIRKYGNKVVVADCSGAEYIRLQMIANHIEVI
ncbi:MAG: RNA-directed DNA polymerase [Eubacterium sp.]|nr:RNA-directed DNA polymerase [Eubacterium sp.]